MTPARIMYLIRYQGPQWFEPLTYFGNNTLKDVYDYEPVQKDWKPEYASLLMGVQGSMWTEFCNKPEDVGLRSCKLWTGITGILQKKVLSMPVRCTISSIK